MPRFFKKDFASTSFIDGADADHIIKSLRMKPGEKLTVCDTLGTDYRCVVSGTDGRKVMLTVESVQPNKTEPTVFVTLYQCLLKGDKTDTVIKQAVEMGVSRIVPVVSENCVSRPDAASLAKKTGRWQKIADEAAGQSGRGILPEVGGCVSLSDAAKGIKEDDICFFFYEAGGTPVEKIPDGVKKVSLIIGPEGGFSATEAEMLRNSGAAISTLGPRILRAETAPVAAVAAIMLQSGNMN